VIMPEIQVRPIQLRDLVRLRSMRTDALMSDQTHGPLGNRMPDPWSAIPVSRRSRRSFVAFLDEQAAGLIDLVADPANHRWVLSRMLTCKQLPVEDFGDGREAVWRELALQSVRAAGAARAKRIHAMLDDDSPVIPVLTSIGFTEYAHDSLLVGSGELDSGPAGITRRQEPSDVWAIHQLYHQITPKPVQYAEALTSNFWSRIVPGQPASRGYVVEDGLEIIAHCRVTRGCDGLVLHLMVHPDALELLIPVVRDVLQDLGPQGKRIVSIMVPDYLQEYIDPLETIGFAQSGHQSRLVKYTVVARRMQFRGVEEFAQEVPERVAAGTPTLSYVPSGGSDRRSRVDDGDRP
jgi:hypothetical protein